MISFSKKTSNTSLYILLLICLFVCSEGFAALNKEELPPEKQDAVLSGFNQRVLYKVNIDVYKKNFSGLLLIKKDEDAVHYHIVLLSEVGLTICEFLSDGKNIELKSASSLFQSKAAQNILAEDFGLLIDSEIIKKKKDRKIKTESGTIYILNEDGKTSVIRKRRIINGIRVDLTNYKNGVPENISFDHRGIKFSMKLNLLKVS